MSRKKEMKRNIAVSLLAIIFSLLATEIGTRLMIVPSQNSYGTLFGIELPPLTLLSPMAPPRQLDRSAPFKGVIVDGQNITVGDLVGFFRQDPILGYAPMENARSQYGWWQSNNIGARARVDTSKSKPPGHRRMLVFGDSFAVGSRVRQEQAWVAVLNSQLENLDVVSLGVDGYSMGQSFLRYRQLESQLDHDLVLLMFVPRSNLWRDVNTRRDIGGSWDLYWVMPRFIVQREELKLVSSPFTGSAKSSDERSDGINDELRAHLRAYDRFYFRSAYETPWLVGNSILYKLLARRRYEYQKDKVRTTLLEPGSEGLQVSQKIFDAMNKEAKQSGHEFVLVFLPSHRDLQLFSQDVSHWHDWTEIVSSTCSTDVVCIDLAQELRLAPASQLDQGYDGTHYGPKSNQLIARLLRTQLEQRGMLEYGGR